MAGLNAVSGGASIVLGMPNEIQILRAAIEAYPMGEPFCYAELERACPGVDVEKVLRRFLAEGLIIKVSKKIYVVPLFSKYAGLVVPDPYKIAKAVARAGGHKICVNGAEAARAFGFSTQMSVQSLFLTTGLSEVIEVGNSKITLRNTPAREMVLADTAAGLALTALYYLGEGEVTPESFRVLYSKMSKLEFSRLCASSHFMPSWMVAAMERFLNPYKAQ